MHQQGYMEHLDQNKTQESLMCIKSYIILGEIHFPIHIMALVLILDILNMTFSRWTVIMIIQNIMFHINLIREIY